MNFFTYLSEFDLAGGAISRYWIAAGWTMLHFLWLGTAIGLAAWAIRRALRPLGPRICYVALLLSLFAMPAGAVRLYGWMLDRTPAPIDASAIAIPIDPLTASPPPVAATPQAIAPAPAPPVVTPADALRQEALRSLGEVARYAPWAWLLGTPATLLFLALGLAGTERLRRQSRLLVTGEIAESARRLAAMMRVSRDVSVAVCDRVVAPMLLGILRPLIVLPPALLAGHSAAQIEMILLHELAHVRRWDNLANLAQRVIEAVLFFHPAVWIVSRWVRLEREHCCDDVVLAHTGDPQTYAETLAALAIPGLAPAHAAAAMANHQLVTRIRQILNLEERSMTISGTMLSLTGGVILTTALIVAAYAQSPPADAKPDQKTDSPAAAATNPVDRAILQRLLTDNLGHPKVDDATFYRRIRLDLTGIPPKPEELKTFLADASPRKREKLVESLLAGDKANRDYATYVTQILGAQSAFNDAISFVDTGTADGRLVATATMTKRPYGAEQLTGPPDCTMGGDCQSAWCSLTADDQEEWLELEYAEPVWAVAVLVYANCSPGAVSHVQIHSAEQSGLTFTWADRDPTAKTATHGISVIPLTSQMNTKRIKITLDSKNTPGWNEIDAVGLLDAQGKVLWATSAKASSTYADAPTRKTATLALDTFTEQAAVRHFPLIGQAVQQGDLLLALPDTRPKLCYVIIQSEKGQDRVVRYTLSGKETVLELLAKVYPEENLDRQRAWILRPSAGHDGIDRILRPDRDAIRKGNAQTNYEVLPGDRIFVSGTDTLDAKTDDGVWRGSRQPPQRQQTAQEALAQWLSGATQAQQAAAEDQRHKALAAEQAAKTALEQKRSAEAADQARLKATQHQSAPVPATSTVNEHRIRQDDLAQQLLRAQAEQAKAEAMAKSIPLGQRAKLALSRRSSVRRQVQDVQAAHEAGRATADLLIDAQRRLADAEREYYLALEEKWNAQRQEMVARDAAKAAANADVRQLQQQLREQENLIKNLKIEAQRATQSTRTEPAAADPRSTRSNSERSLIESAFAAVADKPEKESARVNIKALLGQSATAAFAGVKQFNRVAVDGEETAFAAIAKPNEVIVCGKRVGKAKVRAYDENGRLFLIDVEFVEPRPSN